MKTHDKTKEQLTKELRKLRQKINLLNTSKEELAAELVMANKELVFQNEGKEKRANELVIANKELKFQNQENEKRATELTIANKELEFENQEKEKRATELIIANKELATQKEEKEKLVDELVIANKELVTQQKKIDRDANLIQSTEIELNESHKQLSNFASKLQLVREEERLNLAREIHDSLAQLLVALKMKLGLFKKKISNKNEAINLEEVLSEMEQLIILVDDANKSARSILTGLRPEQLDVLGFVEAVGAHIRIFEQTHHIKCSFKNKVFDLNILPDQALAFFRILQESLNNIIKHAMATKVTVLLTNVAGKLVLEISDNGIGFDVNHKGRIDAYGLIGMKERIKILGGNLDIISILGKGTMIKVQINYGTK